MYDTEVTDERTLGNNRLAGLIDSAWFDREVYQEVDVINGFNVEVRGWFGDSEQRWLNVTVYTGEDPEKGLVAYEAFKTKAEAEAFIRRHTGLKAGNA